MKIVADNTTISSLTLTLEGNRVEIKKCTKTDNELYCLNDIYKACPTASRDQRPVNFLRRAGKDIKKVCYEGGENGAKMTPLHESSAMAPNEYVVVVGKGRGASTYGSLNIVYRYASYISKAFERSVYEAFTALSKGDVSEAASITESVAIPPELREKERERRKKMVAAITKRFPQASRNMYTNYSRLATKASTGFTPKQLTNGVSSSADWMQAKESEASLQALIATYDIIISMLAIPNITYHDIALVLQVRTNKNDALWKELYAS